MGSKAGQIERKWSLSGTDDAAAWEKRPVRFSLAALLRLLTMVALTLGWGTLVGNGADGDTVFRTIASLGCIFTLVVFFRVPGRPGHRVRTALLFRTWVRVANEYRDAIRTDARMRA